MHAAAPWSTLLKGISVTVVALLLGASWLLLDTLLAGPWRLVVAVPPLVVLVAAAFSVRGYAMRDNVLRVQRLLWVTRIELGTLQTAATDATAGTRSLRLFGNGGLFSFCGWFRNARLGRYRAFVTDWQHGVVIKASRCTVVLSPADPAGFVRALQPDRPERRPQRGPARRHVL